MTMQHPLVILDVETTGLDPEKHSMWEVGLIHRTPDGHETEHLWQIKLAKWEIDNADPKAFEVNRFHERYAFADDSRHQVGEMLHPCGVPHPMTRDELRTTLMALLTGAVLVGSNPTFDAAFLRNFLDAAFLRNFLDAAPWYHHTVDIATFAAGYAFGALDTTRCPESEAVPALPFRSYDMSRAVGVEPPSGDAAHTALGDARWAAAVFDAVTGKAVSG